VNEVQQIIWAHGAEKIFKKIQDEEAILEQEKLSVKARERYLTKLRQELRKVSQGRLFNE
jgi:hypothetical protein